MTPRPTSKRARKRARKLPAKRVKIMKQILDSWKRRN